MEKNKRKAQRDSKFRTQPLKANKEKADRHHRFSSTPKNAMNFKNKLGNTHPVLKRSDTQDKNKKLSGKPVHGPTDDTLTSPNIGKVNKPVLKEAKGKEKPQMKKPSKLNNI